MSDGENPVLSYFAASHDSVSWLGGPDDNEGGDPFAQGPQHQIASDEAHSFVTAHSQYDGDNALSRMTSGGEESVDDVFASVQTAFEVGFGFDEAKDSTPCVSAAAMSTPEVNPFLQSPAEPAFGAAPSSSASGIDAYFGDAADNWLGESVDEGGWLAGPEQESREPAAPALPAPPPALGPGQQLPAVAKPALYSVPSLKPATVQSVQPRYQQRPPLVPAKPDGFVSPSKFFPPSPTASRPAAYQQSSSDDPALRKNFPEGRSCGATWAWGGKLFVFATECGMQRAHTVSLHSCGKRAAFQASVARIKAWPGCDASPDVMAKFLNDLRSFKVDDQALELVSPFPDSFDALTGLLSLLLARGSAALAQQNPGDVLQVFDDSNSFSDSMNVASNIDAFRPCDPTRDLAQIQAHLVEGNCDVAVEHAMQSDLWAEAMILAQFAADSALARSVTQRLTERCLLEGTPLWFLHALSCGVAPAGPKLHSHWRLCAKILLKNRFSNAPEGLRSLARAVLSHGDACAWIVLSATAAVFSKEKQPHAAAANFCAPPAADIADLRNAMSGIASIRALKSRDSALWTDQDRRLVAMERDICAKLDELKASAPSRELRQGTLFCGYPSEPAPALMHPTTCERAEIFAAAFAGKAKGHTVRGVLYWRFMHAMWMADHGLRGEAVALFQSVQKRGAEVDYATGKLLSRCAELAISRLEQGRAGSAAAAPAGGSMFGGIGSFVDSTVKFLVTGSDVPAAAAKAAANPTPDRAPAAPQQGNAASSTGPKVVFFNPHAGRSQIAQQLHQQPAHAQQQPVPEHAAAEHEQARAAAASAAPPASPPPKVERSNSDPVKSDALKGAAGSPGDKQKGKGGWGIGSFIGGIVSKVLPVSKGVEVDLGEESTMYYNEKLGRYVERGKEDEAAAAANVAPPPVVAAWSEQPAAAHAVGSQPALAEGNSNAAGVGGPGAVHAPGLHAPSLPSMAAAPPMPAAASGPPVPSAAARTNAPPSSSALGKSRYAVSGVAVLSSSTSAAAPAAGSPAPAARPRPQYKVFVPQAAAAETAPGPGDADSQPS